MFLGLLAVGLVGQTEQVFAQKVAADRGPGVNTDRVTHLFSHLRYASAQGAGLAADDDMLPHILAEDAKYHVAVSSKELFNDDGEDHLRLFIAEHPENPKVPMAHFHLGVCEFRKKRFKAVAEEFGKAETKDLSLEQLEEYYFKLGYAQFQLGQTKEAKVNFAHITEGGKKYRSAAIYYTAHILYDEKNHEAALKQFRKLETDPLFGAVVPYYILQLEFLQDRDDVVVEYGKKLLEKESKRNAEVSAIVGESLYRQGKFADCIPYIEAGLNGAVADRGTHYRLGYAAYRTGNCKKAAENMEKVTTIDDTLSQVAYYQMADCMLRKGEKAGAQAAFRMASRNNFDPALREDALFNFAKLAYDLSSDPYHEAIRAFEEYLKENPNSPRADEAYNFLLKVYLATRSYDAAIRTIESMKKPLPEHAFIFQKAAYSRGIELFNDLNYNASIQYLKKSQRQPQDAELNALAEYWQGDAYARSGMVKAAEEKFRTFINLPASVRTDVHPTAFYNLAYTYFDQKNYGEAISWFRQYTAQRQTNPKLLTDALLRTADSYYLTRETARAIEFYDKAIRQNGPETDYAIFQLSVCYGLQGNTASKIESLKAMLEEYPKSPFAPDALFEIAETNFFKNNLNEAELWFDRLIKDYPKSSYLAKAKLGKGLIAYNQKNDNKALPLFKQVAEEHPGTAEAREALLKIQKIYVEDGNVQAFEKYLKEKNFSDVTTSSLDSSYYESAELLFMRGQFQQAFDNLGSYIDRYPNGNFITSAQFYRAESALRLKRTDDALAAYDRVLAAPRGIFTERSLSSSASILVKKGRIEDALLRFTMLEEVAEIAENLTESRAGIMRCQYSLNRCDPAMAYAEKLMRAERIAPELQQEATITYARCALSQSNFPVAKAKFDEVLGMGPGESAAEAMYSLAMIAFLQKDFAAAEARVMDLVNAYPNYPSWVSDGFLLLADCHMARNDLFQARLVLENIIRNYEGPQKDAAQRRLESLDAAQKAAQQKAESPAEIQFENNDKIKGNLFDEPINPGDQ